MVIDSCIRSRLGAIVVAAALTAQTAWASGAPTRPARLVLVPPLLGAAQEPGLEDLDAQIAARRTRLKVHQAVGFATEAIGAAALGFSLLDDMDRFGPGGRSGQWRAVNLSFTIGAEALTIGTWLLAATSPKPFQKRTTFDTTTVHRILMFSAAGLQMAKLVLAVLLFSATGPEGYEALVVLHRITTYAAPTAYLVGSAIQVF